MQYNNQNLKKISKKDFETNIEEISINNATQKSIMEQNIANLEEIISNKIDLLQEEKNEIKNKLLNLEKNIENLTNNAESQEKDDDEDEKAEIKSN